MKYALVVDKCDAQHLRQLLEKSGNWDPTRKLKTIKSGKVAIPVLTENIDWKKAGISPQSHYIISADLPASKKQLLKTPAEKLTEAVRSFAQDHNLQLNSELISTIPTHWEKHGDLILLPESAFSHPEWEKQVTEFWLCVSKSLGCQRLAKKMTVSNDEFRSPRVSLLLGDSGWVEQVDNGIRYSYDITKCMFSAGNISEKLRIANFNCCGETVVDLYAGIGYFTLPYLVHAGAQLVHACEWNPEAVKALKKNLVLNGVQDKCVIHYGDNRKVCPVGVADRVNLGLIPSSEDGWFVACAALKPSSGGVLHIHSNITSKPAQQPSHHIPASSDYLPGGAQQPSHYDNDKNSSKTAAMMNTVSKPCNVFDKTKTFLDISNTTEPSLDISNTTEPSLDISNTTKTSLDISNNVKPLLDSYNTTTTSLEIFDTTEPFSQISLNTTASRKKHLKDSKEANEKDALLSNSLEQGVINNSENEAIKRVLDKNETATDVSDKDETVKNVLDKNETSKWAKPDDKTMEGNPKTKECWEQWADQVSETIKLLLTEKHGGNWVTNVAHIEHVKSYAPHVDHIVLDLRCRPVG